ncbi:MAG: BREX-1 system adenine-specific DNA-methyltransferase PglX [Chloroflexota bacterium]|nr:BREX-1 system adenine-specific DNA-methyltransferase PglX [Chloroflexota bacterium]
MNRALFFRVSSSENKAGRLQDLISFMREGESTTTVFETDPVSFSQVPGAPFAYWVSNQVLELFTQLPSFEGEARKVRVGVQTSDDFRFVRAAWEVDPENTLTGPEEADREYFVQQTFYNKKWVPLAKGGTYAPYYTDVHLVVNWERDGEEMKYWAGTLYGGSHWSRIIKNVDFYFQPGLTWSERTAWFSLIPMPKGCIFSVSGKGLFCDQDLYITQSVLSSLPANYILRVYMARADLDPKYQAGDIQRMPFPYISTDLGTALRQLDGRCVALMQMLDTVNETSHVFQLPALLQVQGELLTNRIGAWQARVAETHQQLEAHQREIDDLAFALYGIEGEDRRAIEDSLKDGVAESVGDADLSEAGEDEGESAAPTTDSRPLVVNLLSYAVGCVFGRWDVRFATSERTFPELPDPFAPLPVYAPSALTPDSDLTGYPLTIDSDGILVDDPGHPDDIVRRVHDVLELLWGERADAIAQEACALLGVKDMRDYLRKGFFDDHIKRYSKSRRKAPIYWLLQSPKKAYGLWLSYHRLDADMLFKALMQYVEPKLRLEQDRLEALRQQRQQFGTSGKDARQAEKALAQQEALVADVQEFRDRLERAAKHYLAPDLNDGVVLTVAPLWELVPWKDAKTYWNELLVGKYEWSSIGKQLREKKLV